MKGGIIAGIIFTIPYLVGTIINIINPGTCGDLGCKNSFVFFIPSLIPTMSLLWVLLMTGTIIKGNVALFVVGLVSNFIFFFLIGIFFGWLIGKIKNKKAEKS